ncbi:hypothetical protein ACIBG8_24475 [Nonomuraea sp. NPDC050556]|uniref:hypothetical protein n=1 Tax=Nonomuraea sp. NPDC050556 TaxID=3364369 RepID=UPI0037963184
MRRTPVVTFLAIQAVLLLWWLAFFPGLFSRDSVLYLSHTLVGPWISDHSVLYDGLTWLSVKLTGDLGALTLLQTTAMAAALTWLAQALRRLGSPPRTTTAMAIVLAFLPPFGAFSVTMWKDVPFTACAIAIAAVSCTIAANKTVRTRDLVALGLLFTGLGLFRANGFLVTAIAVVVLVLVVRVMRVRLALVGLAAAAIPMLLTSVVLPMAGIYAPSKTYVYHTAFGDLAVAFRERPEQFDPWDRAVLASVAPLSRWAKGGACHTINPLIWRGDFSWQQADAHASELLDMWRRLLLRDPGLVVETRLCRGAIAWKITDNPHAEGGGTYHFSRRPTADFYVGPGKVPYFPETALYTLRPLSQPLYDVASGWLDASLNHDLDWLLWRGAFWCYLSYLAIGATALVRRSRHVLAVGAVIVGQQLAILANISAQDYRYMASPIFIGFMLLPLLVSSASRRLRETWRRTPSAGATSSSA